MNEALISLPVDTVSTWLHLDAIVHVNILDIVGSTQKTPTMLGLVLRSISAQRKSDTLCCLSFSEAIFHNNPEK